MAELTGCRFEMAATRKEQKRKNEDVPEEKGDMTERRKKRKDTEKHKHRGKKQG